jgi:hypothetical protein
VIGSGTYKFQLWRDDGSPDRFIWNPDLDGTAAVWTTTCSDHRHAQALSAPTGNGSIVSPPAEALSAPSGD